MFWYKIFPCLLLIGQFTHGCLASIQNEPQDEEARVFWSSMGDIIEALPFLPVTVNVPDVVSGIGGMMSSVYHYFFGGGDDEGSDDGGIAGAGDASVADQTSPASRLLLNELYKELGSEVRRLFENFNSDFIE